MLPGRRQEYISFSRVCDSFHAGNIVCTSIVLPDNVNEDCNFVVCTEAGVDYCVELTMPAVFIRQSTSIQSDPTLPTTLVNLKLTVRDIITGDMDSVSDGRLECLRRRNCIGDRQGIWICRDMLPAMLCQYVDSYVLRQLVFTVSLPSL